MLIIIKYNGEKQKNKRVINVRMFVFLFRSNKGERRKSYYHLPFAVSYNNNPTIFNNILRLIDKNNIIYYYT